MTDQPAILATRNVAATRLFAIDEVDLRFADGTTVCFEKLRSTSAGAVLVVPITAERRVVLVREYGAGVERYELQLPKGRLEQGERALEAANRELREETGFAARELEWLTAVTLAPGYLGMETQIVLARGLYRAPLAGDEPEEPGVVEWPMDELDKLMARPDCSEARTLAALYMARDRLTREDDQ